jgi:hypothetical protein
MARRVAALLLRPALDENYQTVKAVVYPWPGKAEAEVRGTFFKGDQSPNRLLHETSEGP